MGDSEPIRTGYHRIDGVQEPEDSTGIARTHAWLPVDDMAWIYKTSPWKAQNLRSADAVLKNPDRVFKHIRADDEESGWCYSKRLPMIHDSDGNRVPARPGTVFSVYMNTDCSVYEWGADEADPDDPMSPRGARQGMGTERGRFGGLAWERA